MVTQRRVTMPPGLRGAVDIVVAGVGTGGTITEIAEAIMGRNTIKLPTPAYSIDVTGTRCPLTFVHVKVGLDAIRVGQVLEVFLADGEQIQDVPRSLKEEGHRVLQVSREGDRFRLLVRKGKR